MHRSTGIPVAGSHGSTCGEDESALTDWSELVKENSCDTCRKHVRFRVIQIALIVAAFALYPLSYAPAVRLALEICLPQAVGEPLNVTLHPTWSVYGPVDLLIDFTPLQKTLLAWAELWGVRETFEIDRVVREIWRDPP